MSSNISPKVQQQLAMLQQIQQQVQTVVGQKTQYEMAVKETNRAVEELKEVADDAPVFVNVGTVMMQQEKATVLASLTEKAETLELRIKSLEKQEKALQMKFEQLQAQVKQAIGGPQQAA
ncbi:prefoldin subunit beta [Methanofollis aquaemaris]|uniref:Prefoldin subunit beta n=1 Tax=Methanofollis aquaemaris TaxID=126734 RepID=A0A8A3S6T1_9EURY|nr:prefoldin subunit beta [Methanofollis aquaemaris]QSZ67845.1 prefoldin subunit beta [Methanofollis aquaemaris]